MIERIDRDCTPALLRYVPWEEVPGLLQGVTVKAESGGGISYHRLVESAARMGFPVPLRLRQVHGSRVLGSDHTGLRRGERPEGDGIAGGGDGVLAVVSAADCVPVFLLHRDSRTWAVVHAGWRGVVAGVLDEGVEKLVTLSGADARELELYLGPAICGECYEVGEDVAARLASSGDGTGINRDMAKPRADIRAILAVQAERRGLHRENIAISEYCTHCHNGLFCSWRAEGKQGLGAMWGVIGFSG